VTEVIEQLQASFTSERECLEGRWQQGGEVSTEDPPVALQRYRWFFDRLARCLTAPSRSGGWPDRFATPSI
jgi:hypothetical protein